MTRKTTETVIISGKITLPRETLLQIIDQLNNAGLSVFAEFQGDTVCIVDREVAGTLEIPASTVRLLKAKWKERLATAASNDWRNMQGMFRDGPDLVKALEEEHREELAREDAKLNRM